MPPNDRTGPGGIGPAPEDTMRALGANPIIALDTHIERDRSPLLDSRWSFIEQCRALIDSKAYRLGGGS